MRMTSSDIAVCEAELSNLDMTLSQVEAALSSQETSVCCQVDELTALRQELLELRQLTEDKLIDFRKTALLVMLDAVADTDVSVGDESSSSDTCQLVESTAPLQNGVGDNGYNRFGALEDPNSDDVNNLDQPARLTSDSWETLKGFRCSVPYWTANGVFHYQNAVISDVVEADDEEQQVHVILCNPTRLCEVPCLRWLDGDDCHGCGRSHGMSVRVSRLHHYTEPKFASLTEGCLCLCLIPGDCVWRHSQVVSTELAHEQCHVRLSRREDSATLCLTLDKLLPLTYERGEEPTLDDVNAEDEGSAVVECLHVLGNEADSFAAWEQHTRGLGSRLLRQMGFKSGQGLGKSNQGRAVPVPIEVFPPGKSLDSVLRLRNRKNGVLSARPGKKSTAPSQVKPTVFQFINDRLDAPKASSSRGTTVCARSLDKRSDKSLAVQAYETDREIVKTELKMDRLKSALDRCGKSGPAYERASENLTEAERYLAQLKTSNRALEKHRSQRSDKRKLTVF